ncbi:MAG: DUF1987 domain-containing protein [Rhodospirillales bacterium]|jgi:hypothetical protein|nr:DUF1987 domain-containing protein [Rhodospirillales bacterium]
MENIKIEASDRSPEVDFDFDKNVYALRGESYPEDVTAFFGPVIGKLEERLGSLKGAEVQFDFELVYFNSSSAKVLMGLFDMLDETAAEGNAVVINWIYDEEDDNMEELGEEFAEDLENVQFVMKKMAPS